MLGPTTPVAQSGSEQAPYPGGFSVLGTVTGAPPTVSITAPVESQQVTGPVTVTGTITSPNLASWSLQYELAGTSTWTQFASGNTAAVNATFDPTLLLNGTIQIQLTAIDTSGQSTATVVNTIVAGARKVGLFTLSYTDLSVPLAGIPIQVTRTYDSRVKSVGDFGVGWTLGLRSSRVTVNGPIGGNWQGVFDQNLFANCMEATAPHTVNVTVPNGDQYSFEATLSNNCTGFFGGTPSPTLSFTPVGTTPPNASLTLVGITSGQVDGNTGAGGPMYLMDMGNTTVLDPDQYILGMPGGLQLRVSRQSGLQTMSDLNGNSVTFSPDEILASNGKTVTFTRDGQGGLTAVTDPAGNQIAYTYDGTGNLSNVVNQINGPSTYTYDPTHLMLTFSDPSGEQPVQNSYYPDGQLASHTDPSGHMIDYTHNAADQQEVTTDPLGRITVNYYDASGNLVQTVDPTGATTTRTFDSQNNVLAQTDPLGNTTTYTYDGNNNRLTATDPLGHTTTYTYDGNNRLLTVTDALSRVIQTNTYDGNENLLSTVDAAGNSTTYTYNAQGLPLTVKDAQGSVTAYQYDGFGNRIQTTDALGHVTNFTYDNLGHILTQTATRTTPAGTVTLLTTYQYDNLGRLLQTTYPDGSTRHMAYDGVGRPITTTDQRGKQTSYGYDSDGRLSTSTFPDATTQQFTYDAVGNTLTVTNQANFATSYAYDGDNRPIQTTYADGSSESTTYDLAGQTISQTDARENKTQQTYDAAGRVTQTTDAVGDITTYMFDAVNNQLSRTDARKNTVQYQYDVLNRLVKTTYPDGTYDQAAYDSLGRNTSKTDQARLTTTYAYDALGRLLTVTDALNQVTASSYDEVGDRISQTDANNHLTAFQYDNMGRLTQRTLPLGMSETATYDAGGNLASRTDFNGKTTTYAYDTMNRLLSKTPDPSFGAPAAQFTYTLTGRRASTTDAIGTTSYTYDNRDRLLTKAAPQGTLTYTWDGAGNLLSTRSSNANGTTVNYAYDSLNRLSTVTDNRLTSGVTTYSYDAVGNLAGVLYPNAVQSTYSYDTLNRLTILTEAKGTTIASYAYTLGAAGNRLTVTEANGRNVSYGHDGLYRLTGETIAGDPFGPNGAVGYTYDPVGNRLTRTSTLAAVPAATSTVDANDRLTTDTYDSNGSTAASGTNTYGYDFERRLTQMNPGGVSILYDGDGNRVGLSAAGVSTTYLVDTVNPTGLPQVLEELVSGTVQRVYTYGLGRISENQLINGAWAASFYGYDGQGSVRYLTNSTGTATDQYTYDAFGNQLFTSGTTPNVNRYVGEAFDPALQLTYLRARYMNPSSGRFLTMDSAQGNPFDPPSLHKYLYADGDPVDKFDPLGLFTMQEGTLVHQWVGLNFMAAGLIKDAFLRRSGTGKGAMSLGRLLRRGLSPGLVFPGSRSFPDLVDLGDHFMLEIKTTSERAAGAAQLQGYLQLANTWDPFRSGLFGGDPYQWRAGTPADFTPFPVVFCDTTETCLAFVHPPDPNGVITYDELDLRPTLVTIAVLGTLGILAAVEAWALAAPYITALLQLIVATAAAIALWASQATAEIALGQALLARR